MTRRYFLPLLFLPVACWAGGCAALTNPVADGIPVNRLPDEVLGRPRTDMREVPLNLLRQKETDDYRVDKGDVLGIVADEVLTKANQPIPIQPSPTADRPAATGVPVVVQEDGKIILPLVPPIEVKGLTIPQVREAIIKAITVDKEIVKPGEARVLVDLIQRRTVQVLVIRQDAQLGPAPGGYGSVVYGGNRRGIGYTLKLEAGRNDLLRALIASGGPPGVDSVNEVVIRRGEYDPNDPAKGYVRIPLRTFPDVPLTFTEKDIILGDGDTIYIAARDTEIYYTAGLLGAAQIALPRDYDLRVIEAIAQVRGPLVNGSFNQNQFTANAVNTGIGNPNASLVSVVRKIAPDRQITIRVDLNRAFRDPRENILIQPGDILVMQERPGEAVARYLTQTFRLTSTVDAIRSASINSTLVGNQP